MFYRTKISLISGFVICLTFLFTSSFLIAQRQTGTIEGIVQNVNGDAIPGAVVTVSSTSLIGSSSIANTNHDGFYQFPSLPSGVYKVKAEFAGFQTVVRPNITLSVGFTQTVHFNLDITALSEIVEVIANPPLIDVSSTAVAFTIPKKVIESLPKSDNIEDLMALTPGVSDDLGLNRGDVVNLMAYGASGEIANSVWIDGVNVSNPSSGDLTMGYNQSWIEEVHVTGIGAPAEYGGFTGVIANYTTSTGGNQFHGLVEMFFQNENLTWTNIPDSAPKRPFETYDVSFQLGGPVLKDKLWFFGGIQYPHTEIPNLDTGELTTDIFRKIITKLTYKWNQNNTLQGFGTWNERSRENEGAALRSTPEASYSKNENPQWSWNASWISLLGENTSFEARFGGTWDRYRDIEENPDVPQHLDRATLIVSGNVLERWDLKRSRLQMNSAVSHHADDFIQGDHDFRFGVQRERSEINYNYSYNGNSIYYDLYGASNIRYLLPPYTLEGANAQTSIYAQDDWKVSNDLTLSLGVRWDHNRGIGEKGLIFETDPVAPRLGFVWLLRQDTQTVVKVHFGDYYDALLARFYGLTGPRPPQSFQVFRNGEWVEFGTDVRSYIDGGGAGLKQPYVRQFTAGVDHILPGEIPFGVHYIYRRWANLLETVGNDVWVPVPFLNPLTNETITVFKLISRGDLAVLTNPPDLYRRYDGLEFYASKQFGAKLNLSGSFVYSKLTGNFYGNIFGVPKTFFLDDPNTTVNRNGRLENDRTTNWKIFGSYQMPLGFNTGFYFRHESGGAWTPIIPVPYSVTNANVSILGEPLGSRRIPSRNVLDVRVEKHFPLYSGQLRFTVDIFNVFNSAHPIGVDPFFGSPSFGEYSYTQPRKMRLGIRYTF